jgi:hypothetical protein
MAAVSPRDKLMGITKTLTDMLELSGYKKEKGDEKIYQIGGDVQGMGRGLFRVVIIHTIEDKKHPLILKIGYKQDGFYDYESPLIQDKQNIINNEEYKDYVEVQEEILKNYSEHDIAMAEAILKALKGMKGGRKIYRKTHHKKHHKKSRKTRSRTSRK